MGVPAVFRFGIAWDAIRTDQQVLTATAQLNHPTDNKETFGLGAEYRFNQVLYARTGYEFGMDEAFVPSFGTGILIPRSFGKIRFDYGYQSKSRLGNVHRITLQINIL